MNPKPSPRVLIAGAIAAVADLVQMVLIPGSFLGVFNPINDILDFFVGGIMVWLLGWHWAFMPSFMGKLIPGVDLVPLWSMAVFIVGMGQSSAAMQPGSPASMMPPAVPLTMPGATPATPHAQPQKELTVQAAPITTPQAPPTHPAAGAH